MGTSTAWRGPGGRNWSTARTQLGMFQRVEGPTRSRITRVAHRQLDELYAAFGTDPDAFGLYEATCAAGGRLMDVLPSFAGEERDLRFVSADVLLPCLADEVAGPGGTLVDAVIRRAVVRAGDEVLRHRAAGAARDGTAAEDDDWLGQLLIALFRWFFASIAGEFLAAAVNEIACAPELTDDEHREAVTEQVIETSLSRVPPLRVLPAAPLVAGVAAGEQGPPGVWAAHRPDGSRRLVSRAARCVLGIAADGEPAEGDT